LAVSSNSLTTFSELAIAFPFWFYFNNTQCPIWCRLNQWGSKNIYIIIILN
jgi:hypothetical protein